MSSSANSFGSRFVITSFGESHGPALGVVIDGCPAGVPFDLDLLSHELKRRRPGAHSASGAETVVSSRAEEDRPEILSGVFQGKTLGTPIAMIVRNVDARSEDYQEIARQPRPGHADDVWRAKFGHVDPRGGGRSSGRETVSRVMGGAVAQMLLRSACPGFRVTGFARRIGPFELNESELGVFEKSLPRESRWVPGTSVSHVAGVESSLGTGSSSDADSGKTGGADSFVARFPSAARSSEVERLLLEAKREGKSYGGTAEIWIDGVPSGLGQPAFHKLKADLASAMMGVGATAAVEIGEGIESVHAEGSEFHAGSSFDGARYGGIRGGISTGERIILRVFFKPTSTVLDVAKKGRHDPCIVPRAIPVLESMAHLVLADHLLWSLGDRLERLEASFTES